MTLRSRLLVALVIGSALPASVLAADSEPRLNQRLWLQVGAFRPDAQTTVRIDDPALGVQGSEIGLERDLGLPKRETVGSFLLGARVDERWRAEFEYFALDRKSNQYQIGRSYQVDDTTYTASALIDTEFDSKVARLSAGYSFVRTPESELGAVIGAHVTRFKFSVAGQGTTPGGPVSLSQESASGTVPLPTVGIYGARALSPQWLVNGRADFFSLKHGKYDGRLLNLQTNVFYRFTPHWSVGLGYRYDDYKVSKRDDGLTAQIEYKFRGPQILLEAGF